MYRSLMNRSLIVLIFWGVASTWMAAQPPAPPARAAALTEWKPVGRPASAARGGEGVVVTVDPANEPNTLRSGRVNLPAQRVRGVRFAYTADLQSKQPPPVLKVGWLDNMHNIDDMDACALSVPLETGARASIAVDFRESPCWRPDAIVQQIDVNFDGPAGSQTRGVVTIHEAEVTSP